MIARRGLLAGLAGLGACAPGTPAPPVVALTVKASSSLNSAEDGTPLAVAVRIYALGSRARFGSADVYALMDREAQVLGDTGVRIEATTVRPGETRTITLLPKSDTRYLGIAVLYRDIDRARWRALAPIAPSGLTKLVLLLGANQAELETV